MQNINIPEAVEAAINQAPRFDITRMIDNGEMPTRGVLERQPLITAATDSLARLSTTNDEREALLTIVGLVLDLQDHANTIVYPEDVPGDEQRLVMMTGAQLRDYLSDINGQLMEAELRVKTLTNEVEALNAKKSQFPLHLEKVDFAKLSEPAKVGWRKATVSADTLTDFFNWAYELKASSSQTKDLQTMVESQKKHLIEANRRLVEQATKIKALEADGGVNAQARVDGELQRRNERLQAELAAFKLTNEELQTHLAESLKKQLPAFVQPASDQVVKWRKQLSAIEALRDAEMVEESEAALAKLLKAIKG